MNVGQVLKNISFSVLGNLISFIVSIFMVVVLPKFLSVDEYGKWQLFLFYMTYLGIFTLGWRDGIYLRYAGYALNELDRNTFSGQIYSYVLLMMLMAFSIFLFGNLYPLSPVKKDVFYSIALVLPFYNLDGMYFSILQMTNSIKKYVGLVVTERASLFVGIVIFLTFGFRNYESMYIAILFSMMLSCLWGSYICRRLLGNQLPNVKSIFLESYQNVTVGSKLLAANIVSILIIGVIRFGVSNGWDIATFGKVSLTLSLSNFLMVFIESISVVFFPLLKHIEFDKMAMVYNKGRLLLSVVVLGILLGYYPVKMLISTWLPRYSDSLIYMALLFPICVYESKMGLLINTYFKALRKEGLILKINIISIAISCFVTGITVYILHDLYLVIMSVVALYGFRCILAECYLSRILEIKVYKEMIFENLMVIIFMVTGVIIDSWLCMVFYGLAYILFVLYFKEHIISLAKELYFKKFTSSAT